MSVTHEAIMAKIEEMEARMATKADIKPLQDSIAEMKDAVDIIAAVKTGSRFLGGLAKLVAGLLILWAFINGSFQHLLEINKP